MTTIAVARVCICIVQDNTGIHSFSQKGLWGMVQLSKDVGEKGNWHIGL